MMQGPYIYCGRLGYLGHLTQTRPVEFRWQMLDVDGAQWDQIKTLVRAAGERVESAAEDAGGQP